MREKERKNERKERRKSVRKEGMEGRRKVTIEKLIKIYGGPLSERLCAMIFPFQKYSYKQ